MSARAPIRVGVDALWQGALVGSVLYAGFFGLCVWLHTSTEYFGVTDSGVTTTLMTLFEDAILDQQLGFLAQYIGLGAVMGLLAWGWVAMLTAVRRRRSIVWRRLAAVALLVLAAHTWFLVRSAAHHPALYAPQVDHSLWLEASLWLGTDVLPRWLIDALGAAFIASAGVLVGLRIARHPARRRLAAVAVVALVSVVLVVVTAQGPPTIHASRDKRRPNVLIVAVDSLRSDVVDPALTPHISEVAADGVSFPNTYTVLPRTLPAWVSILTGRYPHHHGIRHMFPRPPKDGLPLATDTLAQRLAATGYRTAVVSDFAGDVFKRGDLGFDTVDAPDFTLASSVALGGLKLHVHLLPYLVDVFGASTPELAAFERFGDPFVVSDRALDWLGAMPTEPDQPFFLTVFYSAGHFPFASPAPWFEKHVDPAFRGRSRFHKATYGRIAPNADPAAQAAEHAHIRGLYRGAIGASDAAIGQLLSVLQDQGLLDNTLLVITADHGETVYEHDLGVGHGDHLYGSEALRVPLILRWPGLQSGGAPGASTSDAPASLLDIAPTLSAELGLPPLENVDGVDLRGWIREPASRPTVRPRFAETGLVMVPPETVRLDDRRIQFTRGFEGFRFTDGAGRIFLAPALEPTFVMSKHRMLIEGDRKLLYLPTRSGARFELYDVGADPGDRNDLASTEPATLTRMKETLFRWLLQDTTLVRMGDYVIPRHGLEGAVTTDFGP
ncbi:MAG: hypothetical protein ACI9MR_000580 [Myxococcota bacterium]|jgi:hypothetical protein